MPEQFRVEPKSETEKAILVAFLTSRNMGFDVTYIPEVIAEQPVVVNRPDLTTFEESGEWRKNSGFHAWGALTIAYARGKLQGLKYGIDVHAGNKTRLLVRSANLADLELSSLNTTFRTAVLLAANDRRNGNIEQFGHNFGQRNIDFISAYLDSDGVKSLLSTSDSVKPAE